MKRILATDTSDHRKMSKEGWQQRSNEQKAISIIPGRIKLIKSYLQ